MRRSRQFCFSYAFLIFFQLAARTEATDGQTDIKLVGEIARDWSAVTMSVTADRRIDADSHRHDA